MMCGVTSIQDGLAQGGNIQIPGTDLAIVTACRAAEVNYDDFTLTVAAGSYPCLPLAVGGADRCFDETDLLALHLYGRLLSFGFPAGRIRGAVIRSAPGFTADHMSVYSLTKAGRSAVWGRTDRLIAGALASAS